MSANGHEGTNTMVFDSYDNTVQICEGGVWVDLAEVAGEIGVDAKKFIDWANENLSGWNDYLMDAIVDFTTKEIGTIYRQEDPGVDEAEDDR